ncbi:DUF937 domain-containing protein [Fulvivirga sedimenti]|uniref:DUF937 domain-containing protein n=1 Tax=Fulvivirga sedimenti TaxID=2879465 RepID=A0A9X1L0G1_9BACT|nr:DUF937 domain-containing protein [Fulvivirga sedimenti]MCA6074619.1 DUF937 domain-containing protein [Fulvivirga sedimenti]MCA6075796.1 DUF937 domain-containing protein [Fulvivirga sedimenti]MCA6076924.1 DUF937 domain-containing protein [Fulvivirga sedimenti]
MLDDLIKSLDGDVGKQLTNLGIPSDKTSDVLSMATSALTDQFQQNAKSGDMSGMLNLFNGNQAIGSSSLVDGMVGNFASQIASKLGISPEIAKSAAAMLIPMLLSKLDSSTPSSGLTEDHLSQILGGEQSMGGITDALKGLFN